MKPRLLLNENMPIPAARRLRATGWEVLHIAEQYASVTGETLRRRPFANKPGWAH